MKQTSGEGSWAAAAPERRPATSGFAAGEKRMERSSALALPAGRERLIPAPIFHGLFLLTAVFAAITLLTEAVRASGFSFAAYSRLAGALTLLVPVVVLTLLRRAPVPRERPATVVTVAALGAVCGALAVTTLRPDPDIFTYLPNAVYYLQHPRAAMGYDVFFLHAPTGHFHARWYDVAIAFEYYTAAWARLLHCRFLDLYFVLQPALFGFLLPAVLYCGLSALAPGTRVTPYALITTVACLLLLGETHRTPLHMSITRFFEGKTVLLSLGVPLFLAESVALLRDFRREAWVFLCLLVVALCGTSISTLVLLPPLALSLAGSYLLLAPSREGFSRSGWYLASLVYLVPLAVAAVLDASTPKLHDPINERWPHDLGGHLALMINWQWPLSPLLLAAGMIGTFVLAPRRLSRLLLGYCGILLLTVFDPWLAPALIRVTNTPAVYWRLFYLFPVTLFVGLAANELYQRCTSAGRRRALVWSSGLLLLAGFVWTPCNVTRVPGVWSAGVGGPRRDALSSLWKLEPQELEAARQVLAVTPPGVMLAPENIAKVIPLLDSRYPQMRLREDPVRAWFALRHESAYGEQRIEASDFAGGAAQYQASFVAVLRRECGAMESIVILKTAASPAFKAAATACGLRAWQETEAYGVAYRPREPLAPGSSPP
jgi:Family of unknown function (DUF6077)